MHNVIIVAVTASAEASAEQGIVQGNLVAGDAERSSGGIDGHRRALRSAP